MGSCPRRNHAVRSARDSSGGETYLALTPVSIISYNLSGIPRKDRVFVERKLYGYPARPTYKEKEYAIEREVLVTQALHDKRLGHGALVIDARNADGVFHLFNERDITYNDKGMDPILNFRSARKSF